MFVSQATDRLLAGERSVVPKLKLLDRAVCTHHRSGWSYASDALTPLLTGNGHGILTDTQVDRRFGRLLDDALREGHLPYRGPWIGIVHCPPSFPPWAQVRYSPSSYMRSSTWHAGTHLCRGLFTLSTRMALWLRERVDVPVTAVKHPTPEPSLHFNFERFLKNPDRRILHIGWFLRRFASFHQLRIPDAAKAMLLPFADNDTRVRIGPVIDRDLKHHGVPSLSYWKIEVLPYQDHAAYDRLLSENIVFLHLYEAVANNTILESIARHTPLLVNPLPDVVEYLGPRYPLYFEDLDEAAAKAQDLDLILQAHEYLRDMPKNDLTAESFRDAIAGSALYRNL